MEISQNFIQFLQACITPVALISGVGLLLLTITNRLGRTIDRTRQLVVELDDPNTHKREEKQYGITILYRRSKYLRNSIGLIVFSVISSSLIIPLLFLMNLFEFDLRVLGYFLFMLSILAILIAAIYLFKDVVLSLKALNSVAKDHLKSKTV